MAAWSPFWWRGRQPPPAPPAPLPIGFDALVSVGPYNLPAGVAPAQGIVALREALNALPGAGWISVEHHPGGSGADAVAVTPADGGDGAEATARVSAAVARVLAGLAPRPQAAPALPAAVPLATVLARVSFPQPHPCQVPPDELSMMPGLSMMPVLSTMPVRAAGAGRAPGLAEPPVRVMDALAALGELATVGASQREAVAPAATVPGGDVDLLAALLARVLPDGASAAQAARVAVAAHGSYAAVLAQPAAVLLGMPGLGPHSVAAIKLVHEAALRLARASVMDQPALRSFDALIQYLAAVLAREPLEHFRVLFLDADGRIRADEAQARGTVNHTPVYPREVARRALELDAASVILVHNHPSGDPSPSSEDLHMTQAVQEACTTVGMEVQDHIIVGNGRWFSFRREGCLPNRCLPTQ